MTQENTKKELTLYERLSGPLPDKAIQRSKKEETRRGYDTTGYGYQFIVNRFNEVLGIGKWNWDFKEIERGEGTYSKGGKFFWIVGEAKITIFKNIKEGIENDISHIEFGGHQSPSLADALKGASTNALKKTSAFFGVGKQAWEDSIDEDNQAQKGEIKNIKTGKDIKKTLTVGEVCEKIEQIKSKAKIEEYRNWINSVRAYNETQKNVMLAKLEEQSKICE